jgi:hypothetical protein
MASLQYVIDSICSSVTTEFVYGVIKARLKEGPSTVGEIFPLIKCKDKSLDMGSAKRITDAAVEELAQRGDVRIEGDNIYSAA